MRHDQSLTPTDKRVIAIMFVALIIIIALSSCSRRVESDNIGYVAGATVTQLTIDSCQYIFWKGAITHKGNCRNHNIASFHPVLYHYRLGNKWRLFYNGTWHTADSLQVHLPSKD